MMFNNAIIPTFLVLLGAGLTNAQTITPREDGSIPIYPEPVHDDWKDFPDYVWEYDDDYTRSNGGSCYYDAECTWSCGDSFSKEECLQYVYDVPDADMVQVPYFLPDRHVDPFSVGRVKPNCQVTSDDPKPVGKCCKTCELDGLSGDQIDLVCAQVGGTYVNPETCDLPKYDGYDFFLDVVEGESAGSKNAGCTTVEEAIKKKLPDPQTSAPTTAPAPTPSPTEDEPDPRVIDFPPPETDAPTQAPDDGPKTGSGSGDPHFKTWTGDKFDYHGECDLVLVDNPTFMDGLGMRVHVRTTRIKYFSYIERIALQIGDDVLEFANDVENFLINGKQVEPNKRYHKTFLAGYIVRRDKKSISVRLVNDHIKTQHSPRIDFIPRRVGFPAVVVNSEGSDIFKGSLGLLGDWATGKRLARDGKTLLDGEDATDFALEWQVRDTEPMLFQTARYPQYPTQCTPPAKIMGKRLGQSHMLQEAEKVCSSWKHDKEDCIFDVMATRDVLAADGGAVSA